MAWFSKSDMQRIRPQVQAVCKKYGVHATLSGTNSLALTINISKGKLNFFQDMLDTANETTNDTRVVENVKHAVIRGHVQFNQYHYTSNYRDPQILAFFNDLLQAANDGNHDNSDVMTDYFDVGWYLHINIGKWDKPYELLK